MASLGENFEEVDQVAIEARHDLSRDGDEQTIAPKEQPQVSEECADLLSMSNLARPGMVALGLTLLAWALLLTWAPLQPANYLSASTVRIHVDHQTSPAERREIGPNLEAFVQSQEVRDATDAEIGFDVDFRVFLSGNKAVVIVHALHDDAEKAREAATAYARTAEAQQGRYTEEFGYRLEATRTVDPVERQVQRTGWHLTIGVLIGGGGAIWTEKMLRR